jgi:hypothetical protein
VKPDRIVDFMESSLLRFWDDHNPPYFHARCGKNNVVIEISSMRVLEGQFPPKALGLVIEWAPQHERELLANWDLARNSQPIRKKDIHGFSVQVICTVIDNFEASGILLPTN